jgi:hypothetical protein
MTIRFAHVQIQGINCAIFAADARVHSTGMRSHLLQDLVVAARQNGLRVDKAALAFSQGTRMCFWGARDLVAYLARAGVPRWTHTMTL